ncbi:hypothetical protein GCM10023196_008290 [Actinoallomurus vinaceus]|uniref:Secreted protein n=1 Tax=Actinoallomurus vinaceus TaxID=1080074 RepID=A0ABP8U3C1_9ACTN
MRVKSLITAVVLGVGLAGTGLAAAEATTTPKPPSHSNPVSHRDPSDKAGKDPSDKAGQDPKTGRPRLGVDKRGCPIRAGGCLHRDPNYTG